MSNFGFLGCNPKPTITKVISHFMAKWAQDDPPLKENKDLQICLKNWLNQEEKFDFFESERKRNYINLLKKRIEKICSLK